MTTNCAIPGASDLVNTIVASSAVDQALLGAISASNGPKAQPTFTEKVLAPGVAAQADWANHTVYVDSTQLQKAVSSGQDAASIIEHELLHLWMETADVNTGVQPHPFPAVGSDDQKIVTMDDGTQLVFDQTSTLDPATGHIVVNDGYSGYEHMLIHQILVKQNPTIGDRTGALASAFLQASSVTLPGGQPQKITDKNLASQLAKAREKMGSDGKAPTPPSSGTYNNCTTSVSNASRAAVIPASVGRTIRDLVVGLDGNTYEVPWDGAIY